MPRYVVNQLFQLFQGGLDEVYRSPRFDRLIRKIRHMAESRRLDSQDRFDVPVSLRWLTKPVLGVPRQPFKLWRSASAPQRVPLINFPLKVSGYQDVRWSSGTMYYVELIAAPDPGQELSVYAIDAANHPIHHQKIIFTMAQRARFRYPGINKLRTVGQGTIFAMQGVNEQTYANQPGWEPVQVVGLPYEPGETGLPVYDVDAKQGYTTPALTGWKAAWLRLEIARLLQMPIPPIPDLPTPVWENASPDDYLNLLRQPETALLPLLTRCLENTDDVSALQENWREEFILAGIRQANIPGASPSSEPTHVQVPVVPAVMLAVSGDSEAATGLGYGTIDFPSPIDQPYDLRFPQGSYPNSVYDISVLVPAGTPDSSCDYMVTGMFVTPLVTGELAALGQRMPGPFPVTDLLAAQLLRQRPPVRDANPTEAVQLTWNLAPVHQGYGVVVGTTPASVAVLNSARRIGGYDIYVPSRPANVAGDVYVEDQRVRFIDTNAIVPITGSERLRYRVVGRDMFGRWSDWRGVDHTLDPDPIQQPALHSVEIVLDRASAAGNVLSGVMHIEFSWYWADRSPKDIEFSGQFYLSGEAPAYDDRFMLQNESKEGETIVVTFNGNKPDITPHKGTVVQLVEDPLLPVPPPGDNPIKYRLTLNNVQCDFSTVEALSYAVYARGREVVRPEHWSDVTGPRTTEVFNPLPPSIPALPPTLQWTALPDATGTARGLLQWSAQPRALGYNVWEATETTVRAALEMPPPVAGATFEDRARDLKEFMTANATRQACSLQAFARLNKYPIKDTRIELELPGSAHAIFVYRISSVSDNNEESERSADVVLFAVPQIRRPGQPRLLIRRAARGLFVIAVPGPGSTPTGYDLYRVINPALTREFGLMGPPKVSAGDSAWQPLDALSSGAEWDTVRAAVRSLSPNERAAGRVLLDAVPARWSPYYYRAVALIDDDMNNGLYGGQSKPSALQEGKCIPGKPPLLEAISLSSDQLTFTTNLPVKSTPYGTATVEIFNITIENGAPKRESLIMLNAHDVPEGGSGSITRGAVGRDGSAAYTAQLAPPGGGSVAQGVVVVTDPAGRSKQAQFTGGAL